MTDVASQAALREARERTVREHMEAENALDFDRALATFGHPRYELIATGVTHDGPEEVARAGLLDSAGREYVSTQGTELGRDRRVYIRVLDEQSRAEIGAAGGWWS